VNQSEGDMCCRILEIAGSLGRKNFHRQRVPHLFVPNFCICVLGEVDFLCGASCGVIPLFESRSWQSASIIIALLNYLQFWRAVCPFLAAVSFEPSIASRR